MGYLWKRVWLLRVKKDILIKKDFSFICPLNRDDFEVIEGGHYCDICQEKVFDVTNCSFEEIEQLQKKHGTICVSVKTAIVTAGLALGLASCDKKPVLVPIEKLPPFQTDKDKKPILMGKIVCPTK